MMIGRTMNRSVIILLSLICAVLVVIVIELGFVARESKDQSDIRRAAELAAQRERDARAETEKFLSEPWTPSLEYQRDAYYRERVTWTRTDWIEEIKEKLKRPSTQPSLELEWAMRIARMSPEEIAKIKGELKISSSAPSR
jgi:hypothetical protein